MQDNSRCRAIHGHPQSDDEGHLLRPWWGTRKAPTAWEAAVGSSASLTDYVTGSYFAELGVRPALGRLITSADGAVAGADPVVVLGYSYWQSRFGGDRGVVGGKLAVNGHPATVIGVACPGAFTVHTGRWRTRELTCPSPWRCSLGGLRHRISSPTGGIRNIELLARLRSRALASSRRGRSWAWSAPVWAANIR